VTTPTPPDNIDKKYINLSQTKYNSYKNLISLLVNKLNLSNNKKERLFKKVNILIDKMKMSKDN